MIVVLPIATKPYIQRYGGRLPYSVTGLRFGILLDHSRVLSTATSGS